MAMTDDQTSAADSRPATSDLPRIEPQPAPTPWLTVRDAADRAKCGTRVIYRAVQAGRLRAVRLTDANVLRLRVDWLDAWLESRTVEVNPGAPGTSEWSGRR